VAVESSYGGVACSKERSISDICNFIPCPVDCVMADWAEWQPCDRSCGSSGNQHRVRPVTTRADHGGAACPNVTTSQQRTCTGSTCPTDCLAFDWGDWGSCSASCGHNTGKQHRSRIVSQQPKDGGHTCGDVSESRLCGGHNSCPVDCTVQLWAAWSSCDKPCGGGNSTRLRQRKSQSAHGGTACPHLSEKRTCNTKHCPAGCNFSDWGDWSSCPITCAAEDAGKGGTQHRKRNITHNPDPGGVPCPLPEETRECKVTHCPQDCKLAEWDEWGGCDKSCDDGNGPLGVNPGYSWRTRHVLNQPEWGGLKCPPSAPQQKRSCQNAPPCPVDCIMADWSSNSQCSQTCGGGVQQRNRDVERNASFGGVNCTHYSRQQIRKCQTHPCPVDCVMSEWSGSTACSVSCGEGTKIRYRSVRLNASNGGVPCADTTQEATACFERDCPIDCAVSPWTDWGPCSASCGGGTIHRKRDVVHPKSGGKTCPDTQAQSRSCLDSMADSCPRDCEVSEWGEWHTCTKSCGGGTSQRLRTKVADPAHGGVSCSEHPLLEDRTCNTLGCCEFTTWSEWSDCSVDCGIGKHERFRTVLTEGIDTERCGAVAEERACSKPPCAPTPISARDKLAKKRKHDGTNGSSKAARMKDNQSDGWLNESNESVFGNLSQATRRRRTCPWIQQVTFGC